MCIMHVMKLKNFNESLGYSLLIVNWACVFTIRVTCETKILMLKLILVFISFWC